MCIGARREWSERYYIQQGGSEVAITPEEGTFEPYEDYYIVLRPITMETGFSLYVEKGDDWGTRLDINKQVEIRVSEFRTLQECDKDFDWDQLWMVFFTSEQFCTQVPFRMDPNQPTDYYVDNCLYVKFNTLYDHDGTSH